MRGEGLVAAVLALSLVTLAPSESYGAIASEPEPEPEPERPPLDPSKGRSGTIKRLQRRMIEDGTSTAPRAVARRPTTQLSPALNTSREEARRMRQAARHRITDS